MTDPWREAGERRAEAWRIAVSEVSTVDLTEAAPRADFVLEEGKAHLALLSQCFGHPLKVEFPGPRVILPPPVDLFSLKILALRYLYRADGSPVTGEWVAYRDLPGGLFYASTIPPTVERPLAETFGWQPGSLASVAAHLGGHPEDFGDESFSFLAFPRVPLLLVLHWGDEEFPPEARVLFDRCCSHYLNTDDLKVLVTQLSALLLRLSGRDHRAEDPLLWMVD